MRRLFTLLVPALVVVVCIATAASGRAAAPGATAPTGEQRLAARRVVQVQPHVDLSQPPVFVVDDDDERAEETRINVGRIDLPKNNAEDARQRRDAPQTASASASWIERRDPYSSGGLTFYETYFTGDTTLYIWWNPSNDQNVIIFIGNQAYLSKDGGRTYIDLVATDTLQGARDLQPFLYDNLPRQGVRTFSTSPADGNTMMVFGYGQLAWVTKDGAATFQRITLPIYPRDILFHPYRSTWLAATHIDASCFTASPSVVCSNELWITTDLGQSWSRVSTHVLLFLWADWSYQDKDNDNDDSLFAQVATNKNVPTVIVNSATHAVQYNSAIANAQQDLYRFDLGKSAPVSTLMASNVLQTVYLGDYIFSVRPGPNNNRLIYVSAHGNAFGLASFKSDHPIGPLMIHDVSDGGVILVERPTGIGQTPYVQGTMWVSDGHGLVYSQALPEIIYLNLPWVQRYALHKVRSLEATHIATINSKGKLKSLITWDKGALWSAVRTQAAIDGTFDDTNNPLIFYGATHGTTFIAHRGFYTEASAPGMILAVGSENIQLSEYQSMSKDGDMYFSRNGGVSFRKVLTGTHFCRFIDEGAFIVCVPGNRLTSTMHYTLDEAATDFVPVTFSDSTIDVRLLVSDPLSFGSYFMMAGIDSSYTRFMIVTVDLSPLLPRTCLATDFEVWTPSDGRQNGRCILGHQISYQRIKSGALCLSKVNQTVTVTHNCPCAQSDFECAFGYEYNEDSQTCDLLATNASTILVGSQTSGSSTTSSGSSLVCVNGHYSQPSGYRRIPGDTCDNTANGSVDWAAPILTPCPVDLDLQQLATILGVSITVLILIVIGFVLFIWWKRKALYASYRNLPTSDLANELGNLNDPLSVDMEDVVVDDEDDAAEVSDVALPTRAATGASVGKLQI